MSRGPGARGQWQQRVSRRHAWPGLGHHSHERRLANVACDTYDKGDGLAAIAAVNAAEPNITFSKKDPMLILDAPTSWRTRH